MILNKSAVDRGMFRGDIYQVIMHFRFSGTCEPSYFHQELNDSCMSVCCLLYNRFFYT
jgi:hypothetical protein